ncbi:MAG: type VI secretion protein IcmF/TssM N-terminal domain-containing protein [Herbaspirillum sp.]
MKALGRFAGWVVILVILAVMSWGTVLYLEWPLWAAAAVFFGVIGLYFLFKFLRRLFLVMRSRSKMTLDARASEKQARQIAPETLLTRKWKAAVATLRNSSLKRFGNPLYVLPWYMVIGKSGSGKTTALTRARLASPIQKINQTAKVQQTLNCDWWYFNKAVVIDCAGRYVGAEDIQQDRREWEVGLDLLAKYRAREGLNGLVLAIGVERLINPDQDGMVEEGRVIRGRIEQLIRLFGKRFPIYVLVTKCDHLYGLENWVGQLPDGALNQAMGYLSNDKDGGKNETGEAAFLNKAFGSIGERLKNLRIALVARNANVGPELLLFPNELEQLKPGLQLFLHNCLGSNPYLEAPFLRGLFFSSGEQEGGAVSNVLQGILPPTTTHAGSSTGLFLHDFFGRILPQDRYIGRPAALINRWRATTLNLGLLAWVLLSISIGILMTVAFLKNTETLNQLQEKYPFRAELTGNPEHDAETLDKVNRVLMVVDQRNRDWSANWMARTTNIYDLEQRLKQDYVAHYRKFILTTDDSEFNHAVQPLLRRDPNNQLPAYIRNKIRYINLLQARLSGANLAALEAMPQMVSPNPQQYSPQSYARSNALRLSHLAWSDPTYDGFLTERLPTEQQSLDRIAFNEPPLSWLVGLAALDQRVKPVTISSFWNNNQSTKPITADQYTVPAGFTTAGKAEIDHFLTEMEKSVDDRALYNNRRAGFETWYAQQRPQVWQAFVAAFPSGENLLSGELEWRTAMGTITGGQSPYYRVIDRLNDEFKGDAEDTLPDWLQLAREFSKIRTQTKTASVGAAATGTIKYLGVINNVGGKALHETLGGAPALGSNTIKNNLSAVDTLQKLNTELNLAATSAIDGTGKAYQLVADFHGFSRDPALKQSALIGAAERLTQLRTVLGHTTASAEPVWQLISGPLHFVLAYSEQQASCVLQKEWESKVNWPLQTATSMTAIVEQLYGKEGTVWAFADGLAKPFLERDATQFKIVETRGYSMPFTNQFLPALNAAVGKRVEQLVTQQRLEQSKENEQLQTQKDQLQVKHEEIEADRVLEDAKQKAAALKAQPIPLTITAQPTSVNQGANSKPFMTTLAIQCAAGPRILNNYNFPVSDSFTWTPGQCGEVSLQIKIDNLILTKKYPGAMGLVRFVQDFRDGMRQFNADEFPASRQKLDALGVHQIGVRYDFVGQDNILKTAQQLERLEQQEKEATETKRHAQDTQTAQAQRNIEVKMAGGQEPPMQVALPERIGVCWNPASKPHKEQSLKTMFKELLNPNGDNASASAAANAAPDKAVSHNP